MMMAFDTDDNTVKSYILESTSDIAKPIYTTKRTINPDAQMNVQ
jgi:hypothetical protein